LYQEADDCPGNLSVSDIEAIGNVYVNQVLKQLVIQGFNDVQNISVFNLAGQKTLDLNSVISGSVDLSDLNKGMYVVQLNHSGGLFTKKILIQ
jgi:hypothetical protein